MYSTIPEPALRLAVCNTPCSLSYTVMITIFFFLGGGGEAGHFGGEASTPQIP